MRTKKIVYLIFIFGLITICLFSNIWAESVVFRSMERQETKIEAESDGQFLLDNGVDDKEKLFYIMAAIDTISTLQPDFFKKVYPGLTRGDIVNAVFKYYQDNFIQRGRLIIDVILSGCR